MSKSKKRPCHLIIPDVHCHPKYDNERLTALGHYAAEIRPDVIVCLGDFADMPSLAKQEKGRRSFEGRRYKDDIDVARDGLDRLLNPIRKEIRMGCRSRWAPRLVMCLGNHEHRIDRTCQETPELFGKLSVEDLGYASAGFEVYPFLAPVEIDGITYAHYMVSGIMGKPIGGENIGKSLCNKQHQSCVVGHSHVFDHSERATARGTKIFGLSAGYYGHREYKEDWNFATRSMWWSGVVVLEDLDGEGYYDSLTAITARKLMRDYL